LILQLTRTGADGTYRFAKEADWDFHLPVEFRDYYVVVLHRLYKTEHSRRSPETSQPIDMALEPRNPSWDWLDADCFSLCMGVSTADCRRAAEFHFGDKTRCNEWLRNPP
jgi:hypothetical protein